MYRIVTGAALARILIAGCGTTGAAVGSRLAQNGHNVVGLKRNPPADQQGIRYCRVDLTRAADLQGMDAEDQSEGVVVDPVLVENVESHLNQRNSGANNVEQSHLELKAQETYREVDE